MARRNNKNMILFFVIGILIAVGVYCVFYRKPEKFESKGGDVTNDAELIPPPDGEEVVESESGNFHLLESADDVEAAFETGFGSGPGVYGSGRHTSEY